MNVDTGELRRIRESLDDLEKLKEEGFEPVPENLKKHANKELGNKEKVMVDMSKKTSLTQWAKSKRNDKKKSKAKMVKASRKVNRR